jgi:cyclohexa-1,5-dienecarbonyl-CoA hydratase
MTDPHPTSALVNVERRDGVAFVSVDRPPLHILDLATSRALAAELRALVAPDSAAGLRAIVLGSVGGRAFSAGVAIEDHTREKVGAMLAAFHDVFRALAVSPVPVLAAVRGSALGGGAELVAFCDAVVAEETATFGFPEIRLGCYPPVAALVLPGVVGRTRAAHLILSGETIGARHALEIGLVTEVVVDGALNHRAALDAFVARYVGHSGAALGLAREAMAGGDGRGPRGAAFLAALDAAEKSYLERLMATHDANEGIAAWMEKRTAQWKDR